MSGLFPNSDVPPPVFSPHRLLRHMGAQSSRAVAILDIVRGMISRGRAPIEQARAAIELGHLSAAAQEFHHLKGSVANLGAMRVYELADELECGLRADADPVIIEQLITCLEREFDRFVSEALQWLKREEARFLPTVNAKPSTEDEKLVALALSLEEHNFNACELFEQLRPNLKKALTSKDFDALEGAISELAFDQARGYLPNPLHLPSVQDNP